MLQDFTNNANKIYQSPRRHLLNTEVFSSHISYTLFQKKISNFFGPFPGAPAPFSNSPSPAKYPHIFSDVSTSFFTSFFMALGLLMIIEPPDDRGQSPCLPEADHLLLVSDKGFWTHSSSWVMQYTLARQIPTHSTFPAFLKYLPSV